MTADDLPAIGERLSAMQAVGGAGRRGGVLARPRSRPARSTSWSAAANGVTAGLAAENAELDWVIPEQGGVRWAQSIGVFKDATKPDLAPEFVKYIVSPEGQARLATSSCYWAMPANADGRRAPDAGAEGGAALGRPAGVPHQVAALPGPGRRARRRMQDLWAENAAAVSLSGAERAPRGGAGRAGARS